MTEQPRLTDAAKAAIEAAGKTELDRAVAHLASLPTPNPPAERSAEYQRGWDDCYAHVLKVLGDNFTWPPR